MHCRAVQFIQPILLAGLLAAGALGVRGAAAQDSLLIIGDSISDPGNLPALLGPLTPQGAPPPSHYWNYRFSNGPSYAELLHDKLGVAADKVFNFAIGGAHSGSQSRGPMFPIDALDQVDRAVSSGAVSEDGLAVYFIGANDIEAYLTSVLQGQPLSATPEQHLQTIAANIATGVGKLAAAGQKRFVLLDLPDLGATPAVANVGPTAVAQASQLTKAHNAGLRQTAARLESTLGVDVSVVSVEALFADVLDNSTRYGFRNTSAPCFIFSHTSRQPFPPAATGACPDVTEPVPEAAAYALFWDPFHPTAAMHALSAEFLAANIRLMSEAGADTVSRGTLGVWAARAQQRLIESRLVPAPGPTAATTTDETASGGTTAYLAASFGSGDREAGDRHRGFDYGVDTVMLGIEREIGPAGLVGAAFGQSTGNLSLEGGGGGGSDVRSVFAGVYGLLDQRNGDGEGPYIGGAASISRDSHDMMRRTGFSPYPVATASPDGATRSFLLHGGYDFLSEGTTYGPVLGGRWIHSQVDSYAEDAGLVSLAVGEQEVSSSAVFVGGRVQTRVATGSGEVVPHAQVVFERGLGGEEELGVMLPNGDRASGSIGDTGSALVVNGGFRFEARNAPLGAYLGAEAALPSDGDPRYSITAQLSVRF